MATVRPAEPADLATLAVLLAEFRDHWGRPEPSAEAIERGVARLHDDPDSEFLMAPPARGFALLRFRFTVSTDSAVDLRRAL